MTIDFHVHPVSRALVHDERHRRFMEQSADCLAPERAVDLLLDRMQRGGMDRASLLRPTLAALVVVHRSLVRRSLYSRTSGPKSSTGTGQLCGREPWLVARDLLY